MTVTTWTLLIFIGASNMPGQGPKGIATEERCIAAAEALGVRQYACVPVVTCCCEPVRQHSEVPEIFRYIEPIPFGDPIITPVTTPNDVPEPASMALLGLGTLGVVGAARRK